MKRETDPKRPNENSEPEHLLPSTVIRENLIGLATVSDAIRRYANQLDTGMTKIGQAFLDSTGISSSAFISSQFDVSRLIDIQNLSLVSSQVDITPFVKLADEANQAIGRLLAGTSPEQVDKWLQQIGVPARAWDQSIVAAVSAANDFQRIDTTMHSHLTEIAKSSVASQLILSRLDSENLGSVLLLDADTIDAVRARFLAVSESFSTLFSAWCEQPTLILSLPPVLSRLPAAGFLNQVEIMASITPDHRPARESQEEAIWKTEWERDRVASKDRLKELLIAVNPELMALLHGARLALVSSNPDHLRHFATSLRELCTHVLHALAPDNAIRAWSTNPEHYYDNRPTRRARLSYICRTIDQPPFSSFVEKWVDAEVEFLNLFQRGTHEVIPEYTPVQAEIMLEGTESLLRFLLEIWHSNPQVEYHRL